MRAEVIAIGDEILVGRTLDTNSHVLAGRLHGFGVPLQAVQVVEDDPNTIREALALALRRARVVILTGGLGPTRDDCTKDVLAQALGDGDCYEDAEVLAKIEAYYAERNREVPPVARGFAAVPNGATALANPAGAAPGLHFRLAERQHVFALPGVPYEMAALLDAAVLPILRELPGRLFVRSHTFRTVGVPESSLADRLRDLEKALPAGFRLAYNPGLGLLDLRLYAELPGTAAAAGDAAFQEWAAAIRERIGPYHYGDGDDTLEAAVGRRLQAQGRSIALAESCTGGAIAARLVRVPGASAYVRGGLVAYTNAIKTAQLGVREADLATHGAVSEPVARQMAEGVRALMGADLALATTGVAGPGGGTAAKPVGQVWMALASGSGPAWAEAFHFEQDRDRNIERTTLTALHQVWKTLGAAADAH